MRTLITLCSIAALSTGCASIVGGHHQSISVETRTDAGTLNGANCKLVNNKGTWYVTSPGSTMVQRSYEDIHVTCQKEPHPPGMASVKSTTKPLAVGNVIFGGLIGVAVDTASGAAFDYPPLVTVEMGKSPKAEAPADAASAPTKPKCDALLRDRSQSCV